MLQPRQRAQVGCDKQLVLYVHGLHWQAAWDACTARSAWGIRSQTPAHGHLAATALYELQRPPTHPTNSAAQMRTHQGAQRCQPANPGGESQDEAALSNQLQRSASRSLQACSKLANSIPASVHSAGCIPGGGRNWSRSCRTFGAATCCTKWHSERSGTSKCSESLPPGTAGWPIVAATLRNTDGPFAAARRRRQTSATSRRAAANLWPEQMECRSHLVRPNRNLAGAEVLINHNTDLHGSPAFGAAIATHSSTAARPPNKAAMPHLLGSAACSRTREQMASSSSSGRLSSVGLPARAMPQMWELRQVGSSGGRALGGGGGVERLAPHVIPTVPDHDERLPAKKDPCYLPGARQRRVGDGLSLAGKLPPFRCAI